MKIGEETYIQHTVKSRKVQSSSNDDVELQSGEGPVALECLISRNQ